jgi:hypothetical protein
MHNPFMGTGRRQEEFLRAMKEELVRAKQSDYDISKNASSDRKKSYNSRPQKSLGKFEYSSNVTARNRETAIRISFGDVANESNNAQAEAFLKFAKKKGIVSPKGGFFQIRNSKYGNCLYIERYSMGGEEYHESIQTCLEEFNEETKKQNEQSYSSAADKNEVKMEENYDNEKNNSQQGKKTLTPEIKKVYTTLGEIGKKNTTVVKEDVANGHILVKVAKEDVLSAAYALHSKGYKVNVPEDMKKEFKDYIKEQDAEKSKTDKVEPKKSEETSHVGKLEASRKKTVKTKSCNLD